MLIDKEISAGTFGDVAGEQEARSLDSGWQEAPATCEGNDCDKPPAEQGKGTVTDYGILIKVF